MQNKLLIVILVALCVAFQQDKPAYQLFNHKGKSVKYNNLISALAQAEVVLFGEYHDNPISHWLQLEVTQSLHKKRSLVLGAEMFEADNQDELDQYLSNDTAKITEIDSLRLWPNYRTDYAPLVDFAKSNKIPFVATNIPRRFARMVYKHGFESLDSLTNEKAFIAPLPIKYDPELPGYKAMLEMMGGHGGENLPRAQAIKDATMAYFIMKNLDSDKLFVHYNGSYHSNNFEGIGWYLKQEMPNLNLITIATVSQENPGSLLKDNKGLADYIIVVDEDMTSTH